MDYDEDDLPAGYPNTWSNTVASIRLWRVITGQGLGGTSQIPVNEAGEQDNTKTDYQRFYERAKKNPEWVAKRRAYYRAKYAEKKK